MASIQRFVYPTGTITWRLNWKNEEGKRCSAGFRTEEEALSHARELQLTIYKGRGKGRTIENTAINKRLEVIEMRISLLFELFEQLK